MTAGGPDDDPAGALVAVVVDDEPDVAAYLTAVLERAGHSAHSARTTSEALELVSSLHPDVVCIDVVMPEESGIALYRRIRSDPELADTPVVFISALKREMTPIGNGSQDEPLPEPEAYIEKPPDAEAFIATVVRAAASRGGAR